MRLQNLFIVLTISCTSGLLANVVTRQSATAQTASQIKQSLSFGVPVVMPNPVPFGFRLTSFKVDAYSRSQGYKANYQGPNACEFSVSGSNGGWGAPGPVRQWVIDTKLLGKVILEEWSSGNGPNYLNAAVIPGSNGNQGPLASKGFPRAGYVFNFSCKNTVFPYQKASQILKSVQISK